jgi:hypothetical protein
MIYLVYLLWANSKCGHLVNECLKAPAVHFGGFRNVYRVFHH